ncbi:MAG: TolC family protein [Syntrophaceae bacterium]|nr:TolC family protein [Syntrophaceae bacterium]
MINKKYLVAFFTLIFFIVSSSVAIAQTPLTLEESVDIALKNSFVLNIAKEGTKSATAQKREALTGFLPKLSTSYSYRRLNEEPYVQLPFPPGEMTTGTRNNYNWNIEARQPIFAGGGIIANYMANKIGEDVASIEEKARYQDVVQEVKIAYFDVLRAQRVLEAADQSVKMLEAHRNVADNYFQVGFIAKNDLLHAEVELANGRQTLIRAQNAVDMAKSKFNTLLKRRIFEPVEIVDILNYQPLEQSLEECLAIAKENRPELKVAALKAEQASKAVWMARSELFPSLSLVGNYARFGDEASVSGSRYQDAESWYVMAVASWNFWEWGRTKFRVDASKARENQAIESSKEINDQITLEIKNAYLLLREAENQIVVSEKVIEQAEENFRISEERYKERVSTSTEVLDAQTLLTRAKSQYANALGDYNINYAKLQRAMGIIAP